jgi:hypothetical protein
VTPEQVAAFVAATCAAQGLQVKVTDPGAIRAVVTLLGGSRGGGRAHARSASTDPTRDRLEQPLRTDPVRVQSPGSADSGQDDDVVDQGAHDGDLLSQGEARPA